MLSNSGLIEKTFIVFNLILKKCPFSVGPASISWFGLTMALCDLTIGITSFSQMQKISPFKCKKEPKTNVSNLGNLLYTIQKTST